METVKLSTIVLTFSPELYPLLTPDELESFIVLKYGLQSLDKESVIEIVEASIERNKEKDAWVH
ncbi:hypothetical protein L1765_09840 [Microaerobacter geothermalis]|uniref:hypothetical protein n=1 Tax=Microaerobacter geothermalis TaxID=674972 RepID=UPI001F1C19E0|nr:hypothetical protein [Microaerobacter geothermalis]MCF6094264.1 hypothetical protein [Microaerobacter geothermalis]